MQRRGRRLFLLGALAGAGAAALACAPTLGDDPPVTGIRPVFSPETGQIPLPNDLLRNPTTRRLELPVAESDSPLTKEIKASINRLDGWLSGSAITIPFDVELDKATLTPESVLLFDVTRAGETPPVVRKLDASEYFVLFNVGRTPATAPPYTLTLRRKPVAPNPLPAEFTQGGKYAAIVTDAVRAKDGRAFLDNPIFYFLRSRTPLAADGKTLTILPDKDAAQLEVTRAGYDVAFKGIEATGFDRAKALAFTVFTVESGPRAVINPTPLGESLPSPIDKTGPANAPVTTTPTISFDQPLDPSTLAAGTHLYRVESGAFVDVPVTAAVAPAPDAEGRYPFTITPSASLAPSTTYVVVLTDAIKGRNGVPTEAYSFFSLCRNQTPLLDTSKTPPALNSPFLDSTLDALVAFGGNPQTATPAEWEGAYTTMTGILQGLEELRQRYAPHFAAASAKGLERLSITALWQFTTSSS